MQFNVYTNLCGFYFLFDHILVGFQNKMSFFQHHDKIMQCVLHSVHRSSTYMILFCGQRFSIFSLTYDYVWYTLHRMWVCGLHMRHGHANAAFNLFSLFTKTKPMAQRNWIYTLCLFSVFIVEINENNFVMCDSDFFFEMVECVDANTKSCYTTKFMRCAKITSLRTKFDSFDCVK